MNALKSSDLILSYTQLFIQLANLQASEVISNSFQLKIVFLFFLSGLHLAEARHRYYFSGIVEDSVTFDEFLNLALFCDNWQTCKTPLSLDFFYQF